MEMAAQFLEKTPGIESPETAKHVYGKGQRLQSGERPSGINEPKTPPKPVEKQTTPFVTPVDISPVPTIQQKNPTARGRKSGSAVLLTSSPYKNQLADDVKRKSPTDKKTYERKSVQKKQADKVPTQRKRQKKQSQISSDSEGEELDDPVYISTDNEDSEDDAECPYCNGKFSCDKRGEKWIVCKKCGIWCHEECPGEDDYKSFICVYCLEATQRAYQREFGVRNPPKRNTILGLVNKLETTGSLVTEKGNHRSSRLPTVVVDETGYTYSMCQRAAKSVGLKPSFFDDRIISRNLWPPRSPDLTTPDFFLWGYLKDRVYATRPETLDDLKHNITQEIQANNRVLQRVASNMERRVELCLMQDGEHFQHLL
ncbi:hypothetical protein ANN_23303 [Periplaneta americana]|uniref:DUF4817 domain-containing protein n=1 Tax=Periplaneta americana TaxID=6978 RepID=A0ABQ8SLW1_PERAM|nr:hypothetical protein ANN_23303 [Periplaneta americana]